MFDVPKPPPRPAPSFDTLEIQQRGWNDVPVLSAAVQQPAATKKRYTQPVASRSFAHRLPYRLPRRHINNSHQVA